jgi:reactive intermediate/imine deaminase
MRRIVALFAVILAAGMLPAAPQEKRIIRVGPDLKLPFSPAVRSGDFIYVSGTLATDDNGKIVPGDIKIQTERVLANLAQILEAAGSGMQDVLTVTVYLANVSDFAAMNEVYKAHWPKDPPARTTISAKLVLPGAIVEMSAVAVPKGGARKVVQPAEWLKSPLPYSYGILSGDTLFLAGLVSRNGRDNAPVTGEMKAQVEVAMKNAGEILKSAGMGYGDVVSSRVYITDTAMFQDMNSTYRAFFPKDPPARATVRAALVSPEYLVEITMVAARGGSREAVTTPNADGSPGQANPNLSSAIRIGKRLFVSGMMGNNADNKGDIKAQTGEAMARIGRTLAAAGFDWSQVVEGVVYITDLENFGKMNEGYRGIYQKDFPARATVETGLVSPEGLVEIMFTAVK